MRFFLAAALAAAVAAMAAGCAGGTTTASGLASARPVSARPVSARPVAATASMRAGTTGTVPPVFAASFTPAKADQAGDRLALLSSRAGALVRWLTTESQGAADQVLSVRDGWVYFVRDPTGLSSPPGPAIWRVRVTGGRAQLIQAGATGYAVSPDGRAVASVISADHGDVLELAVRNLVTGRRQTIVMAARPAPGSNNWPPNILSLTWAPDDVHLAVQFQLTAAINTVLVFDAFTAATYGDGRTVPAPCPVNSACGKFDPAYLASGVLTYVIQRVSRSGAATASLVAWQAGHLTTLLSFPAGVPESYDMTAQGQAIWASEPAQPKGPWTIWRWSGGAPVELPLDASASYWVGAIAW
jgi:hypothetical protein